MRQLTSLDAQFLALESSNQTGHVAGLAIRDPSTTASGDLTLADVCRLANYPVSVITDGIGLNITVMSYCGHMDFGIVADRDQMPDLWSMLDRLRDSPEELK